MKTSPAGLAAIAHFEGERLTAYQDSVGVWTIGIGHTAAAGEPRPVAGMTITHEEALSILARDLPQYETAVSKRLPNVPQNVFDGAVSFCFNVGTGNFNNASWPRYYVNGGRPADVEASLKEWNRAGGEVLPGLVARRAAEADMIFRNRYPSGIQAPPSAPPNAVVPPTEGASPMPPAAATTTPQPGFLDSVRNGIDALDDKAQSLATVLELVPFIGPFVKTIVADIHALRETVDALDPK